MEGALTTPHTICGTLTPSHNMTGAIFKRAAISGALTIPTYVDVDLYSGSYDVSPNFIGQILPTANKTMTDDVTVKPIEVQITTNTSGGKTVFIGGI